MPKKDDKKQGMTSKKHENFADWYPEVVQKAELADYSPIKGCMVVRPNAYAIWQKIQDYFNPVIKKHGVKNAYFPMFIPESFFHKEAKHAEGFSPEVAWIGNKDEGEERLAVRPTSETIIADSFAKWIRSWEICRSKSTSGVLLFVGKQTKPDYSSEQENSCGRKVTVFTRRKKNANMMQGFSWMNMLRWLKTC